MDFLTLLARLADLAPETGATPAAPRRAALSRLGQMGAALLPALLTALPHPSAATTLDTRVDVFTLLLSLEYLQNELYSRALGLVPGGPANVDAFFGSTQSKAAAQTMQQHQAQHVALLLQLLTSSGAAVPPKPNMDFTGSQNGRRAAFFPGVFSNFDTFLQVAQLLEDTGVRTYKGQADFLQSDNYLLETTLRMHTTEARHAAHIRGMRRQRGATVKPWISPSDTAITTSGTPADVAYAGEGSITQVLPGPRQVPFDSTLPINVGTPPLARDAVLAKVAEAFDEPLNSPAAAQLVQVFTY